GGLEQEIVDHRLVLVGNGSDLGGPREAAKPIRNPHQARPAVLPPRPRLAALGLWRVPISATGRCNGGGGALRVLAARQTTTQHGGAAGLDGSQHLQLCVADMAAVGLTPSGPEVAEDVRNFQSGTQDKRSRLLRSVLVGR